MIHVFSMLFHSHNTIKKSEIILSEYQILNQSKIIKITILYLKKNNPQIALIELHVDADVKISQFEGNTCVDHMYLKTISKKMVFCY